MSAPSPEHVASITRAVIEEAIALVAVALFIASVGGWVMIIAEYVR